MHGEFDRFGPHFEPGLIGPNGKLTRFHKGADNSAAIREQKAARKQSAAQFAEQMKLAQEQLKMSQHIQTPTYTPPSPAAAQGVDVVGAGMDYRRRAARRFGAGKTVFAGESGYKRPALGGGVALGA